MRRILLSALTALSLAPVVLAQPAQAAGVTIDTAREPVTLAAPPARVAAFDVAAIDTLTALGVPLAGVPDKLYVPALKDVDAPHVGTLFEPDLEALANLAPDLIIVGGRTATQRDALAQLAPTIDMSIGTEVLAHTSDRLAAYAALFDRQAQAQPLKQALDDKLAALAQAGKGKGRVLVVMTNGPKMSLYGPGSRFGWLYQSTGMAPAVEGLDSGANHGNAVSAEFIAKADPDWLFVLDRGAAIGEEGQSAQATLNTPLIAGTKAWRNGQVAYLPSASLYIASGGYASTVEVIDALTAALNGAAKAAETGAPAQ